MLSAAEALERVYMRERVNKYNDVSTMYSNTSFLFCFKFKYYVFGLHTTLDFIAPSEVDIQLKAMQELQRNVHRNKQQ